jgi:hypothetical protein
VSDHTARPADPAPSAFEIPCPCGQAVTGQRGPGPQVVACPGCGRRVFVFPQSAWGPAARPAARRRGLPRGLALSALLVSAAALGAMAALYLGLRPFLARPDVPRPAAGLVASTDARGLAAEGRRALAGGNFRRARRLLADARRLPAGLDDAELTRLVRLHREADFLADLLRVSLQEILRQGQALRDEEEWQAQFADYRGRSVLFDDVVRADDRGRPVLAVYAVSAGGRVARLALEDLTLWQQVPLDRPRRLLFGARLAGCDREAGGRWAFHFQPASGVLLTDRDAAAAVCPAPLDPEIEQVLKDQARWSGP